MRTDFAKGVLTAPLSWVTRLNYVSLLRLQLYVLSLWLDWRLGA